MLIAKPLLNGAAPACIFFQEPSHTRVVVSGAVVVQRSFSVELPDRVLEPVRQRPGRSCWVAKRIETVGLRERAASVCQRCDCAETINVVEIGCAGPQDCQRLINV